jgi:nitrogen fixation NifU-like protein
VADLEELYREIILDHYRSPRNRGELTDESALRAEGFNPLCGDEILVTLHVEGDVVTDIKISGQGCSISQSSASLMSAAVKGKPVAEVRKTIDTFKTLMTVHEAQLEDGGDTPEPEPVDLRTLGELAALQGVVKFPMRIKCATLGWNTLTQALNDASL